MVKISHDSETAAHGQQVITACALIHHTFDGVVKILLPKRANTKKFLPNVYEIPGGHIDFGENIVDGLKREIREELEIDITVGELLYAFDYMNEIKGSHSVELIYFATLMSEPGNITTHPEDHSEYKWFAEHDIDEIISPLKSLDDPELLAIRKAFSVLRDSAERPRESVKFVVYVPETHADIVREALGKAGAGTIGDYKYCSFSVKGTGRFIPQASAHPAIGEIGQLEAVPEERIETVCYKDELEYIIDEVNAVHPYEEVAFDIFPLVLNPHQTTYKKPELD